MSVTYLDMKLKEGGTYLLVLDGKVYLLPHVTPPHTTQCRNHAPSVLSLNSCFRKHERRKRVKVFLVSPCGGPWREIRCSQSYILYSCAVSKWDFTPRKGQCWLLVKCFKSPRLPFNPFRLYFLWEPWEKKEGKRKDFKGNRQRKHFVFQHAHKALHQVTNVAFFPDK